MKRKIANRWVKTLRSGEYEKGCGLLVSRENDKPKLKYCCLGVLTHMYAKDMQCTKEEMARLFEYNKNSDECEAATLPIQVREWAGMSSNSGILYGDPDDIVIPSRYEYVGGGYVGGNGNREPRNLADINDDAPAEDGFSVIADIIEANADAL